jgi:hypothetical protein
MTQQTTFSAVISGTTINIVFRPENQPFFNGVDGKYFTSRFVKGM